MELVRSDNGWSSGKVEINDIGDVIECQLMEGKNNAFTIIAYDDKGTAIPCFPKEINIMQGIVVGNAVLPYNISIEAHDSGVGKNVVNLLKAQLFWIQVCAIGIWLLVLQNYFGGEDTAQRVYVVGGNIDADVSGTVDIDNTVSVEVENTVRTWN